MQQFKETKKSKVNLITATKSQYKAKEKKTCKF